MYKHFTSQLIIPKYLTYWPKDVCSFRQPVHQNNENQPRTNDNKYLLFEKSILERATKLHRLIKSFVFWDKLWYSPWRFYRCKWRSRGTGFYKVTERERGSDALSTRRHLFAFSAFSTSRLLAFTYTISQSFNYLIY